MNPKELKWHKRYMELCDTVGSWSEDPKKKVGSCIVKDNRVLSVGFNGLPSGVQQTDDRMHNSVVKLQHFEHAERNAIYTAARVGVSLVGAALYCNFYPCTDCARGIIQSGITKVIVPGLDPTSKWYPSMLFSVKMFEEAGIEVILLTEEIKDEHVNGGYYENGKCKFTDGACSTSYAKSFLKDEPCDTCKECLIKRNL